MLKIFTILILFCITPWVAYAQDIIYDSTIMIIKKQKKEIEYHNRDIEVVRKKDDYLVYVYRIDNDTIRPLRVSLGTTEYFDKAGYKWDKNNGVVIQLFEERTGNKSIFINIKGNKKRE